MNVCFKAILSVRDVLVGHSLENDLHALKLYHTSVIDTALSYGHTRGPGYKSSLRYLAREYLDREIQCETHDSVEDAKACLDLVKLKLEHGIHI